MINTLQVKSVLLILLLGLAGIAKVMAATAAGTVIRNQASATYLGTDGRRVTVTSNIVQTTIEQVASVLLEQNQTISSLPDNAISISHRVRNNGNGNDRFDIQLLNNSGEDFDLNALVLYADQNQDGVADNTNPITQSFWLAPDEEFYFVIGGAVPASALAGDSAELILSVVSNFDASVNDANTDTVQVVDGANIIVNKTINEHIGLSPSGNYEIILEYQNNGNQSANNVVLIDALPAGMSYVAGSGRWNNMVLTDANPNDAQTSAAGSITYCAYDSSCTGLPESAFDGDLDSINQVTATVSTIAAGITGVLSFEVSIDAGLPGSTLYNTAEHVFNAATFNSNTVAFSVLSSIGVVANGSTATAIDGMSEPINVASAGQGSTARFSNIIWNTGSNVDTFNIELDNASSTFPIGSFYRLLKADGATPLLDTNADGQIDTGPVQPGEYAVVVLSVVLPDSSAGDNNGLGFSISKLARSIRDNTIVNAVEDHLDEIIGNSVDLTNQAAAGNPGALGVGPGPELTPVSSVRRDNNGYAHFDLFVRNQGQEADQYHLTASTAVSGVPLSQGWEVTFTNAQTGQTILNTSYLQSGESVHIIARLSVPADVTAGIHAIYFKAQSLLGGTSDTKHDAVMVVPSPELQFEPNLNAQLEPGGSVVYKHVVSNNSEFPVDDLQFAVAHTLNGWTAALYQDTDADGYLSPADQLITGNWTLPSGESRDLFVKVFAPSNAALSQSNITTVVANWSGGDSVQVRDISTVSTSNVSIKKEQAIDAGCDGTPDPGTDFVPGVLEVAPGNNCVIYRLTATNLGRDPSYNVTIYDYTPPYTLYRAQASCTRNPCWLTEPENDKTGTINAETDQLLPGDSFSVQFSVRVE